MNYDALEVTHKNEWVHVRIHELDNPTCVNAANAADFGKVRIIFDAITADGDFINWLFDRCEKVELYRSAQSYAA